MQHIKQKLNPNPERHNAGQPDSNYGTQDFRQNGGGQSQGPDALSAPGPAMHPQQHYNEVHGLSPQAGAGVGQQGGRAFNDPSQNDGDQAFPITERQGLASRDDGVHMAGAGLGREARDANTGSTVPAGDHNNVHLQGVERRDEVVGDGSGQGMQNQRGGWDGGNNASMAMRQEERERGGAQGGWDGGMGVMNDSARNDAQQGYSDNTGNAPGRHTDRHAAEAGAATGAATGVAHHAKGGHGDGLHNNGDHRQLERDFVGRDETQAGAGTRTGVNTIPDGSFDGHGVHVERAGAGMHPQQNLMRGTGGMQTGGAHANPPLGTDGVPGAGVQGGKGGYETGLESRGVDTDANYASGAGGQAPGAHPTGFGAGQGAGTGSHPGTGHPGQPTAGSTAGTGSGTGTSSIITGKLQQAAGMLLSNDTMRAKGLEKEAKGEALRNVSHAQELVQEADSLRERAGQKNGGMGTRHEVGAGNDGRGRRVDSDSAAAAERRAMNVTLK